jgi:hypothetical protein
MRLPTLATVDPLLLAAPMDAVERFMAYATAFEQTFSDDDWSRLEPYFAEDAVYEVRATLGGCEIAGRSAILEGLRKSINGFDRHFADRVIALTVGPEVRGNELELDWTVTYTKDGAPPYVLEGKTIARLEDDRIVHMADIYAEGVMERGAAWIAEHAPGLDPSYV